ncbi:Aste57867_14340 [Aphanomyces stellatus]|uniref:Aste57867_14340 protein n=1 Tax=Aphanomyces stellatus TaxID=120398 RepID=A0A485L1H3_9STRA|nr:hypothetical protein As57867_014286 [Aphanomyces stellatus]VFT91164.1 Aste57867_14340 [Aphanomyces stellatus]
MAAHHWKKALKRVSSMVLSPKRSAHSSDELPKMTVRATCLLAELITYVDTNCFQEEDLYRKKGAASEVDDLLATFNRLLLTASPLPDLHMYTPHAITSTIKKILRRYQPLVSYNVSQALLDASKVTPQIIATHFVKIRSTSRDALRGLLLHFKHISDAKHLHMDVSLLAQCVGILLVRPSEDAHALTQRGTLKTREKIARKLIRGAATWPYECATELNLTAIPDAKELLYAIKVVWHAEQIQYDDAQLRAVLQVYGDVQDLAVHPTDTKARATIRLKRTLPLDKVVVKLQKNAQLYALHMQVLSEDVVDEQQEAAGENDTFLQVTHRPSWPHANEPPVVVEDVLSDDQGDALPKEKAMNEAQDTPPLQTESLDPVHDERVSRQEPREMPPMTDERGSIHAVAVRTCQVPTNPHVTSPLSEASDGETLGPVTAPPPVELASTQTEASFVSCDTQTIDITFDHVSVQTDSINDDGVTTTTRLRRVIEVLRTTTASSASSGNESLCAMHQAQCQVLKMLEALVSSSHDDPGSQVADANVFDMEYSSALTTHMKSKTKLLEAELLASHELLRMHKAQSQQEREQSEVEMTSLRLVAHASEQECAATREQLRNVRSELACHLATMAHLKRENAALADQLLLANTRATMLETESMTQKAELQTLEGVATKAQLRVESYKLQVERDASSEWVPSDESTKTTRPPSAVDHLAQIKAEMSERLQTQIDMTKATIGAMNKQDTASVHLAYQQQALSSLMTELVETQEAHAKASDKALAASRAKLHRLYEPTPRGNQPLPIDETTLPWMAQMAARVGAHGTLHPPSRPSKSNPDSLNAARLSLLKFQQLVGQFEY